MAPAVVTIAESLRPWRNAGLEFVFDEHGLFAAASEHEAAQHAQPAQQVQQVQQGRPSYQPSGQLYGQTSGPMSGQQSGQAYGQPPAQYSSQAQPSPSYQQGQPAQGGRPQGQPSHAQAYAARQKAAQNQAPRSQPAPAQGGQAAARGQQPAGNVRAMGTSGLAVHPTSQPPEQWPAQWQAMWGKVKSPSAVVWTYWSLGDDLSGRANAERGALLRKIIGSLQLPAGSSAFWPVSLPEVAATAESDAGSELIAAPEIFLAGLRRVRPRYCITFGSKALRTFAPDLGLAPYTFTQFLGHRLIALPDIDILLKNQGTVPAVIAFLKTAVTLRG